MPPTRTTQGNRRDSSPALGTHGKWGLYSRFGSSPLGTARVMSPLVNALVQTSGGAEVHRRTSLWVRAEGSRQEWKCGRISLARSYIPPPLPAAGGGGNIPLLSCSLQ